MIISSSFVCSISSISKSASTSFSISETVFESSISVALSPAFEASISASCLSALKHEALIEASNAGDSATLMELSKTVSEMENEVEALFEILEIEQTKLDEIITQYEKEIENLT